MADQREERTVEQTLEERFRGEGITTSYLQQVLSDFSIKGFDAQKMSYTITEAPLGFGRRINSRIYFITVSAGTLKTQLVMKEPLKPHALYGARIHEMTPPQLAESEYQILKHLGEIPVALHQSSFSEKMRLIMPLYPGGSMDKLLMSNWYPIYHGRGDTWAGNPELLLKLKPHFDDVLRVIVRNQLQLTQYSPVNPDGSIRVFKPNLDTLTERASQYFGALTLVKRGIRNGGEMVDNLDVARSAGGAYARVADDLKMLLDFLAKGKAIIHGDCRPENVLVNGGEEVEKGSLNIALKHYQLIDWGGAKFGQPTFDLVTFSNALEFHNLGIYDADEPIPSLFTNSVYAAMATVHYIRQNWRGIVHDHEKMDIDIAFHVTPEEHEDMDLEYRLLRIWDCLNRAGVYALSFLQHHEENQRYLESLGDIREKYSLEYVIDTYLNILAELCIDFGFKNTAQVAQELMFDENRWRGRELKKSDEFDPFKNRKKNRGGIHTIGALETHL